MEIPIQIGFRGMDTAPEIEEMLSRHLKALENRFGRITSGRLVLTGPGQHHRTGGLYDVHVQLTLPDGKSVAVARTDDGDERYSNLHFAINDAFKRARRRLQDQVRRLQNQMKHHEPLPLGTVARIDPSGDLGFIATAGGQDIYFHKNSVVGPMADFEPNVRVSYVEQEGEKGPQASTVKLVRKHRLR
ncbi:MAG: cold shock domain-containing protein [Devosia sp.]|nr:cold shock domain-containing protein [Devosia sp.]